MRQGIRKSCLLPAPWGLGLLLAVGALPAHAATLIAELSAGKEARAWALLGDVELRENATFLTFGYSGLRSAPDTAATHQFSLGVDHALSERWLVSGSLMASLPKVTLTPLAQEMPRLGLPALTARTSHGSQGLLLSAGYASGGLSDVEYGVDLGLGLTRYPLRRAILARTGKEDPKVFFPREDRLGVLKPSLGGRLLLGLHWELGLRGGIYLYSEDPLSAGQFSEEEQEALARHYAQVGEDQRLQSDFVRRIYQEVGAAVASQLAEANAMMGLPSAPVLFDVKPSVTWRINPTVRGQLSYSFAGYVPGEGVGHILATRWTFRLGEPVRLWASVALQVDVLPESPPMRAGLATLGAEYSF